MSNYVIKYSRGDRVKYISHLDFVRMFHRTVRRAGLPFVFSQGFNPHPVMTVAVPLSVGVTADGEYMKVGFDTELSESEIAAELNRALPDGFCVRAVKRVEGKELDFNKINTREAFSPPPVEPAMLCTKSTPRRKIPTRLKRKNFWQTVKLPL